MRSNPRQKLGRIFFFLGLFFLLRSRKLLLAGYGYIVANGYSCDFAIQIQGWFSRHMEGFMWKALRRDTQTLNFLRNVSKFCVASWELNERAAKSKFVARSRSALCMEI